MADRARGERSRQQLARRLDVFDRVRARTLARLEGLEEGDLGRRPGGVRWSIGEVLDHLFKMETYFRGVTEELISRTRSASSVDACRSMVRLTVQEFDAAPQLVPRGLVPLLAIPMAGVSLVAPFPFRREFAKRRFVRMRSPRVGEPVAGRTGEGLAEDLARSFDATREVFGGLGDLDPGRLRLRHPLFGIVDVVQLLTVLALHEERHHRQMSEIEEKLRGSE